MYLVRDRVAPAFDELDLREEPPSPEKPEEVRHTRECPGTAFGCIKTQTAETNCCRPKEPSKPPAREY